ncbi:uncharacterized protein N7458_004619 [Penicillium daleae]|uniref:Uncharacterized protein n=1 Tax=Penicillium daleae TaxID=63821 RepID=A0AAD6C6Q7_9EURO|nr:uncharacterized protein N7458_004619 [Penicillium daleae]KAJ5453663.1 hypothetical protein N7458_004619 [Penicillium daleae]
MDNSSDKWAPMLCQERFDSFAQIRKYHVELLTYWSNLIAYRLQSQTTEGYYDILDSLTELANYISLAGIMLHVDESSLLTESSVEQHCHERTKYIFLSERMLEMIHFLTTYPDMMQLSDVLKMYAVQLGRLRFLGDGSPVDEYADGLEKIAAELCPKWRANPEHWHSTAWTELQIGMNSSSWCLVDSI